MIDLSKYSGFPLWLDVANHSLEFGRGVAFEERIDKDIATLAPVLEQETGKTDTRKVVYSVFRGVAKDGDRRLWSELGLRYDLTLIRAGKFGREFPKTFGHRHLGPGIEIYQVLHGKAYSLLDKWQGDGVAESILIEAGVGQAFAVLPGVGHITINPFDEILVLANVVPLSIKQDYSLYEKNHGGSHYFVESELSNGFIDILGNPNINSVPALWKKAVFVPKELKALLSEPLYKIIKLGGKRPELIAWLKNG